MPISKDSKKSVLRSVCWRDVQPGIGAFLQSRAFYAMCLSLQYSSGTSVTNASVRIPFLCLRKILANKIIIRNDLRELHNVRIRLLHKFYKTNLVQYARNCDSWLYYFIRFA